jgi:dolichyl-phosphate-mannose-protein mannosyltransferase
MSAPVHRKSLFDWCSRPSWRVPLRGSAYAGSSPEPHGMECRVAGSVRPRILERSAKRASGDAVKNSRTVGKPAVKPDAPHGVRAAWRRLNVPSELVWLTFFAAVTRFTTITHPRAIVFDEVYFRDTALRYLQGSYFFDLHPPLGKLLLAGWAKLVGVTATAESTDPAVALRILPALAGTALVVVFYLLLRELTASQRVATFGSALLLLDNAVLVESRLILIDSMLLLFGIGALTCYLASRHRTGRPHWILLTASAVLAGMAASTKLTGLTALGVIGLVWLVQAIRNRFSWRRALAHAGILVLVPAFVYASVFAIHFQLLPHSGPGDAFMSQHFQSTLVGNPNYNSTARMSFTDRFIELNKAMHTYEISLNSSHHPYSSTWLSWPFMKRPVYYWTSGKEYIYFQGNPIIWWGILLGVVVVAIGWIRRPELFRRHYGPMALLTLAWVANFLPLYGRCSSIITCSRSCSASPQSASGWDCWRAG